MTVAATASESRPLQRPVVGRPTHDDLNCTAATRRHESAWGSGPESRPDSRDYCGPGDQDSKIRKIRMVNSSPSPGADSESDGPGHTEAWGSSAAAAGSTPVPETASEMCHCIATVCLKRDLRVTWNDSDSPRRISGSLPYRHRERP